ncbi:hypothetical protein JG688_00017923 [Phytophthora aleatoria]|uniref:Uncharacterized protein n=1 Tax=Phytophthora aleatoria TaxID=2496075 RepID=A0A8J5IBU2_9STRA|nr:hypothetical protein JG688_00017923 [Phytophthora aleatoria]
MSRRQGFGGTLRAKQEPKETEQPDANGKTERLSLGVLAQLSAEEERTQAREELKQMSLLSPWTSYKAYEPSFTDELNRNIDQDDDDDDKRSAQPLLCVQFPTSSEIAALNGDNHIKIEEDEEQQAVHFRSRPVAAYVIEDAAVVATKREPQEPRVRYIMSTRLGALPPTKRILDEYPIPKEVLDALERHRHFHVDDSSPLTAFEPIRLPPPDAQSR